MGRHDLKTVAWHASQQRLHNLTLERFETAAPLVTSCEFPDEGSMRMVFALGSTAGRQGIAVATPVKGRADANYYVGTFSVAARSAKKPLGVMDLTGVYRVNERLALNVGAREPFIEAREMDELAKEIKDSKRYNAFTMDEAKYMLGAMANRMAWAKK